MSGVNVDVRELVKLREQLEKIQMDAFCRQAAKELAKRLLRKVIKRTPVGDYTETYEFTKDAGLVESGREGGKLRRAWLFDNQALTVTRTGGVYKIEIKNSKDYASYVEYGHRQEPGRYVPAIDKKLKKGWVEGKFMLTKSEEEIRNMAPKFLEKELENWLREALQ